MRIAIAMIIFALSFAAPALAQSCNPVIDGTYCEMYPPRNSSGATGASRIPNFEPIRPSLGQDLSPTQDLPPATLGTMTFRGDGSRCIGLLRRGNCN